MFLYITIMQGLLCYKFIDDLYSKTYKYQWEKVRDFVFVVYTSLTVIFSLMAFVVFDLKAHQ